MKNLLLKIIFFSLVAFLGAILLSKFPQPAWANHGVCGDTSKWGNHNGTSSWPAGFVVYTQFADGTRIGGINFTIQAVNGASILRTDPNDPYSVTNYYSSVTFRTGTGDLNQDTGETTGRFWCARPNVDSSKYDSYTGVAVLGFGTSLNYGNHYNLSCRIDGRLDTPSETFKITNVSSPAGRTGYWSGNFSGWDTGFGVTNGDTRSLILTWHDSVVSTPTPTPTPTPPNLTVDDMFTMDSAGQGKDTFWAGETVYVGVKVRNSGSDPVGQFWTKIYATSLNTACGNNTQDAQFNVMSLAGLSTVTQTVSFTIPSTTPTGLYYVQAFTDATCWISESNESDNTGWDDYWVSNPTDKPDLVVEFMGLHDGVNYKTIFSPGETVYATVRINNVGGKDSEPNPRTDVFREKLDGCNNTTYSQRLGSLFGISLLANGKTPHSLTFTFTAPLASGNYTAYAFVDSFTTKAGPPPYCDNDEEYENNNVGSAEYNVVSPCPTFTLSDPSGSISDPMPYFAWSTSSGGGFQFQVQLSKISSFSSYWFSPLLPTFLTFLSWPADWQTSGSPGPPPNSGLEENVDYYWRVLVTNLASCVSAGVNFKYVGSPWMMTKGGDVAIKGNISLAPPAGTLKPAEYAVIASGDITKNDNSPYNASDLSSKSWKLRNYSNLKTPPRSTYSYFWSLLSGSSAPSIANPGASGSLLSSSCPATPPCVFRFSGTEFVWDSTATQTLPAPVIIFVGGNPNDGQESDFKIQKSLTLSSTSPGVIFIVEGNVLVHPDAQEIHGVFIVNKQFKSEYTAGANPDNQLKVKGSVIAYEGFSLTRDRGSLNSSDLETSAAEFFEFQPRYLVEFRQIIGAPLYSWTEVSP